MINLNLIVVGDYISYASLNRNKEVFSIKLPLIRCTRLPYAPTLTGEVQRGRRFEGGIWPVADRLQAQPSFPPGRLQHPGKGCHHIWVSGNVRVFTLPVLPAQSAQVKVLEKRVTLDCREYRPQPFSAR